MMNRQQLMEREYEQLLIQNQQKDELLKMLFKMNHTQMLNEYPQYHQYPQMNNEYFLQQRMYHPSQIPNSQQHNLNNFLPTHSIPSNQFNPISNYYNYCNSNNNNSNTNNNTIQINNNNNSNQINDILNNKAINNPMNVFLNNNNNNNNNNNQVETHFLSQETKILAMQNQNLLTMYNKNAENYAKKCQDQSDFSQQLDDSLTRVSLNRNSFGAQQQQQSQQQSIQKQQHQQQQNLNLQKQQQKCEFIQQSQSISPYTQLQLSSQHIYSNEQDQPELDFDVNRTTSKTKQLNQISKRLSESTQLAIQINHDTNNHNNNNVYSKINNNNDHIITIKSNHFQKYTTPNPQSLECGYKQISKNDAYNSNGNGMNNNNNNFLNIKNNPIISRLADYITYVYTFEPEKLENNSMISELFERENQQKKKDHMSHDNNNHHGQDKSGVKKTVIKLNNSSFDDQFTTLNENWMFQHHDKKMVEQNQFQQQQQQQQQNKHYNFQDFTFKSHLVNNQQQFQQNNNNNNNNNSMKQNKIQQINLSSSQFSDEYSMDDEEYSSLNENEQFIQKSRSSFRLNTKLTKIIENFLKNKLVIKTKENSNDNINEKLGESKEKGWNMQKICEKVKNLKGLLDFEDIQSLITINTSIQEEKLNKEVQQILHHFKSNHKVYFKKVRSQKEMLKDTKFHNLNKRIMRVLLQILNNPIILSLKVPKPIFNFFMEMSQKLILSSKKLIKNTIVNDQYSHAHYNTMFLQISASNYSRLSQSTSDVELHKVIYNLDLTLPFQQNYFEIQKTNILKQYIYLILDKTLRLNDTSQDSQIQSIRSLYIERVIKGMEKMNAGKIVQRF